MKLFFTKSTQFLHLVELQVAVLDPAEAAADHVDGRRKDRGQDNSDEHKAQPVKARGADGFRALSDGILGGGISPMLWDSMIGTPAIRDFIYDELIEI